MIVQKLIQFTRTVVSKQQPRNLNLYQLHLIPVLLLSRRHEMGSLTITLFLVRWLICQFFSCNPIVPELGTSISILHFTTTSNFESFLEIEFFE